MSLSIIASRLVGCACLLGSIFLVGTLITHSLQEDLSTLEVSLPQGDAAEQADGVNASQEVPLTEVIPPPPLAPQPPSTYIDLAEFLELQRPLRGDQLSVPLRYTITPVPAETQP